MIMKYYGIDIALLLIRVGLAVVFMAHGFDNIIGTIYFVGVIELISGIAMLVGLATSWAGILMAADMIGAVTFSKVASGFGGYELELVLFLSAIAIAFAGSGRYVIPVFRKKS
jgi:putative oxidoreductase